MPRTRKKRIKRAIFTVLTILIIFLVFFAIAETFSRAIIGKRLIVTVEESGLYYFNPNQEGWYSYSLKVPKARINNIGARGSDIEETNKTKYVFFGDSFTFGWGLNDNETIPVYFNEETKNPVINFGNGGYGLDHMIESYKFHNSLFKENDVILVFLIEADFYRPLIPYQKSFEKEMFWKVKEKSSFIAWTWATSQHLMGALEGKDDIKIKEEKDIFIENREKLLSFNDLVEGNNQKLIYVFYEYNKTKYSLDAGAFCKENSLNCITDIYEFTNKVDPGIRYIYDGSHPSKESNKEVATGIAKFINNN
ncbi:MAG: SGNH/GDSL hydrolase family protein [Candidatus Nanoarchaeia archaeon]|nr:SGNH/GDSL hydrolase family protein [Candidatus Nanoarchaeia archaeon]